MDIIDKMKKLPLKQRQIAEITGLSNSTISEIMSRKVKPSKHVKVLLELCFGDRAKYINPTVEALVQIVETLEPDTQKDILRIAKKEKQLQDIKDEEIKKAA